MNPKKLLYSFNYFFFRLFPTKKTKHSTDKKIINTRRAKLFLNCSGDTTEQINLIKPDIANNTVTPILNPSAIALLYAPYINPIDNIILTSAIAMLNVLYDSKTKPTVELINTKSPPKSKKLFFI